MRLQSGLRLLKAFTSLLSLAESAPAAASVFGRAIPEGREEEYNKYIEELLKDDYDQLMESMLNKPLTLEDLGIDPENRNETAKLPPEVLEKARAQADQDRARHNHLVEIHDRLRDIKDGDTDNKKSSGLQRREGRQEWQRLWDFMQNKDGLLTGLHPCEGFDGPAKGPCPWDWEPPGPITCLTFPRIQNWLCRDKTDNLPSPDVLTVKQKMIDWGVEQAEIAAHDDRKGGIPAGWAHMEWSGDVLIWHCHCWFTSPRKQITAVEVNAAMDFFEEMCHGHWHGGWFNIHWADTGNYGGSSDKGLFIESLWGLGRISDWLGQPKRHMCPNRCVDTRWHWDNWDGPNATPVEKEWDKHLYVLYPGGPEVPFAF